jgi:hypothetical protein
MKYAIISSNGHHEFDIQVIETEHSKTYSMYRSHSDIWTDPGEHIQTITDDGNGMQLNVKLKKKLDYGNFTELTILLDFIKNHDSQLMESYEIYQKIN